MRGVLSLFSRKKVDRGPQVIRVKVWDGMLESVVFDGQVSMDAEPCQILNLPHVTTRFRHGKLCIKGSNRELNSFKGLRDHVELVVVQGSMGECSGVVYVDEAGVVRTSSNVPSCSASIMSVYNLPHEDCVKVFHCVSLEDLVIDAPSLLEIPRQVSEMTKLRKLNVSSHDLVSVAEEIRHLKGLKELHISSGRLKCVPVGGLENLEVLEIFCVLEVDTIPEEIGQMKSLKRLSLSFSRNLKALPKSIAELKQLEYVFLGEFRACKVFLMKLHNCQI